MAANSMKRLLWFVAFMARHRNGVKKSVIDAAWARSGLSENKSIVELKDEVREVMPRATFYRLIDNANSVFGVSIVCDQKTDKWYIKGLNKLNDNSFKAWMIDTLGVFGLVNENRNLQEHIMYEEMATGKDFLEPIIQAINDRNSIRIHYHSYMRNDLHWYELQPYGLKMFRRRWYVVGEVTEETFKKMDEYATYLVEEFHSYHFRRQLYSVKLWIFPLDRISDVELTENRYEIPEDFKVDTFFGKVVGPFIDHRSPIEIKLKAKGVAGRYLMTLPIHHSQEMIEEKEGENHFDSYRIFKYNLFPTHYFYKELLWYGDKIEILEPESVRQDMREMAENILKNYKKD